MQQSCKQGEIYRIGYVRETNGKMTVVPGKCIRATSQSKLKRSSLDKEYIAEREQIYKNARKRFSKTMPKSCPSGQIIREGYYRRSKSKSKTKQGAWVAPTCMLSRNKVKKKRLFTLEQNTLGKYGYHDIENKSDLQRHRALKRALKDGIEPLPLLRRVNALAVLNKNKNPTLSNVFKNDIDYIRNTTEYKQRPTRSKSK